MSKEEFASKSRRVGGGDDDDDGNEVARRPTHISNEAAPSGDDEASLCDKYDLSKVLVWAQKTEHVHAKGLAKRLPAEAVQDLREGKLSPSDLKSHLSRKLVRSTKIPGTDFEIPMDILILLLLGEMTIDKTWCRNESQTKWQREAELQFAADLCGRSENLLVLAMNDDHLLALMQCALNETCEAWADRVDKMLFKGRAGTFLFLCPTHGLSLEEFRARVNSILQSKGVSESQFYGSMDSRKRGQLERATIAIQEGVLDTRTCWECGETPEGTLKKCATCQVASYCCRDCQVSAWKSGHKGKCRVLRERYAILMESLQAIDSAHKSGGQLGGFFFDLDLDYTILSGFMLAPLCSFFQKGNDEGQPPGPSMKFFYENLGRVIRKEWWFVGRNGLWDSHDSELESSCSVSTSDFLSSEIRAASFISICCFLCFDFFGGPYETREMPRSVVMIPIPAERFLKIFQDCKLELPWLENRADDRIKMHRRRKNEILVSLRSKYHK